VFDQEAAVTCPPHLTTTPFVALGRDERVFQSE
jgi:hypothetical protein